MQIGRQIQLLVSYREVTYKFQEKTILCSALYKVKHKSSDELYELSTKLVPLHPGSVYIRKTSKKKN